TRMRISTEHNAHPATTPRTRATPVRPTLALLLLGCGSLPAAAAEPARPNILFIFADDQSYKTVGCYPEAWPWVRTPNLDALAKTGVRFHGAYLGLWCMPSRGSIRTGRLPAGVRAVPGDGPGSGRSSCPH